MSVTAPRERGIVNHGEVAARWSAGPDGLCLVPVSLVPEIRLYLASDPVVLWARMEADAGHALAAPFWASAWLGGQALARYVLDHPEVVAGRRVLDLGAGSGLVGIGARLAGAASVTANDIDPYAVAAIEANARVNGVRIAISCIPMEDEDLDVDVVLVGDAFYSEPVATTVLSVLRRASACGARVLIGDPGRTDLPRDRLRTLATYSAAPAAAGTDAEVEWIHVLDLS